MFKKVISYYLMAIGGFNIIRDGLELVGYKTTETRVSYYFSAAVLTALVYFFKLREKHQSQNNTSN
jgi:hypothetical protein